MIVDIWCKRLRRDDHVIGGHAYSGKNINVRSNLMRLHDLAVVPLNFLASRFSLTQNLSFDVQSLLGLPCIAIVMDSHG
jgi:hypothetical protein